ncbi:olfactory receptor 6F1-like [Phyllobates terribilis]|uniref:olfactory receptor 6F1-like n=1 Tax=Phyllobates terribilis TaxID=111132 RepID=UPI003CCAFE2E
MCKVNQTEVIEFLLLGFKGLQEIKIALFTVFLLVYIVIVVGNLLIVVLVSTIDHLQIPMFIFLKHLATADILLTTTVMPAMLDIILVNEKKMFVVLCIIQMNFIFIFGFVQCFFIAIMSYDRCLAICNPLHYASIMSPNVCVIMIRGSWCLMLVISSEIILVFRLQFCNMSHVDSFFCDFGPVVDLATSDTSVLLLVDFIVSVCMIFFPFAFTVITYICIFITILSISPTSGRSKAFSTCSSHLATVCAYYGTLMTASLNSFDKGSSNLNNFISLLYIVVTPLLNPIIYSLRNQEIKRTLQKMARNFRINN